MAMPRSGTDRNRNGFALLATLWLIVAIAAVALEISLQAKDRRMVAINISERGQAVAAANAGIATLQSRMGQMVQAGGGAPGAGAFVNNLDPDDPLEFADSILSETYSLGPGMGAYTTYVKDAGAVLSVYYLDEERWRLFLRAVGVDFGLADKLAQSIMDWTDRDFDRRAQGAERDDYISAGRIIMPSNTQLTNVAQLKDVMGMTPEIYNLISPYLVFSLYRKVNVNKADPVVLRSLPGMTDDAVAAIMSRRYSRTKIRSMDELLEIAPSIAIGAAGQPSMGMSLSSFIGFYTEEVFVSSVGVSPNGSTQATVQAVLRQATGAGQQAMIEVRMKRSF